MPTGQGKTWTRAPVGSLRRLQAISRLSLRDKNGQVADKRDSGISADWRDRDAAVDLLRLQ
jgi:hypothetical protein